MSVSRFMLGFPDPYPTVIRLIGAERSAVINYTSRVVLSQSIPSPI